VSWTVEWTDFVWHIICLRGEERKETSRVVWMALWRSKEAKITDLLLIRRVTNETAVAQGAIPPKPRDEWNPPNLQYLRHSPTIIQPPPRSSLSPQQDLWQRGQTFCRDSHSRIQLP
jgi:hypothetical protein